MEQPEYVGNKSEKQIPILMACHLSVRYEINQLRFFLRYIPYHVDKRVMIMSWSNVSKKAERSSRVTYKLGVNTTMLFYDYSPQHVVILPLFSF